MKVISNTELVNIETLLLWETHTHTHTHTLHIDYNPNS